jgi:hypothetical protein
MEPTGKPATQPLESVLDETLKKPMNWQMIDALVKLDETEERENETITDD